MSGIASSRQIIRCVLYAAMGAASMRADVITVKLTTAQFDVIEGQTLNLDFQITNTSATTITFTSIAGVDGFVDPYTITGGLPDTSDSLLQGVLSARSTKAPNNMLGAGEPFTYRVSLQTPDPFMDPPAENNDFGEWMLRASGPTFIDSANDTATLPSETVRVFDTPEPSMLLPVAAVCIALLGYRWQQRKRAA
jgi:hypothetical protein